MADFDRNQAAGAGESEKTRLVKRLRELAAGAKNTEEVLKTISEIPSEHKQIVDLMDKCDGVMNDGIRVAIRLLARSIEAGEVDLGEHSAWTDEDVAQEVLPWPETRQAFDTMRAQGVTVDQQKVDELRASLEPTSIAAAKAVLEETRSAIEKVALDEELTETDADLLRALADDLSSSKHALHRAAVARLYEIAERLDAEPAPSTDMVGGFSMALHYIELEARVRVLEDEKLKNTVARGRIEQEVDNLVTGTAFMGDRVETHHREIGSLDGRIDTLTERLDEHWKHWDEQVADINKKLDDYTERLWVCQQDVEKLEGRALTAEELAAIRAGLAEESAPVEEVPLVCVHQSRNLGACAGVVRQAEPGPLCEEHYTLWSGSEPPTFGSR